MTRHNMENEKLELAWRLVENTGANVFLTGKAGTGKTTFLRRLKEKSRKTIAVLAPTGIAALNAHGMTIHSFFQLSLSPYIPGIGQSKGNSRFDRYSKQKLKVIRSVDMIVIDEISMVRADILDAIDSKLRKYRNPSLPMGGVQLVMIGDMQQLPPVVREDEWQMLGKYYASPYFFDSQILRSSTYETIELTEVYRQKDREFITILNAIRENKADENVLRKLNSRYIPGFNPPEDERYIRLLTHNYQAQQLNEDKMRSLPEKAYVYTATIEGDFPESLYPIESELVMKKGAQVMFIKNDSSGSRRYYNGLIGHISEITKDGKITVETDESSLPIEVTEETWENTVYEVDGKRNEMKEKVVGRFSQIPLRAAWAITIHKSQGLTFDKAIINASAAFAHGQTYVALSRCRSLDGLVLERALPSSAIICDRTVTDYLGECTQRQADAERIDMLQANFKARLLMELIDMTSMRNAMDSLHRVLQTSHGTAFPKITAHFGELKDTVIRNLTDVSIRFQDQLRRMLSEGVSREKIQERISAGCLYFLKELRPVFEFIASIPGDVDNKDAKKKFAEALDVMEYEARMKEAMMTAASEKELTIDDYMRIRREVSAADSKWSKATVKEKKSTADGGDIENPEVYERLVAWRNQKARELDVPAYVVFGNKTLVALANDLPENETDLLAIPGIGRRKLAEYGEEILALIQEK